MNIPSGSSSPGAPASTSAGSADTSEAMHSKYSHVAHDHNYLETFSESSDGAIEQKAVLKRPASTLIASEPVEKKRYFLRSMAGSPGDVHIAVPDDAVVKIEDTTDQQAESSGSMMVDEKLSKAEIRRQKNILAARASREREKEKQKQLEQEKLEIQEKNSLLTSRNAVLTKEITRLECENRDLEQKLAEREADSALWLRVNNPRLPVDSGLLSDDEF